MKNVLLKLLLGSLISLISHSLYAQIAWKAHAKITVKPQHLDDFKVALSKVIEPTKKEAGCISYEAYQVLDEEGNETNVFEFHELWVSKEAMFIDHLEKAEHMQEFFLEIKMGTDQSFVEKFEADSKYVNLL